MSKELTEIQPLLDFKSTSNEDFEDYDFISAIGGPESVDLFGINDAARLKKKCHNFCYEFNQKYFMVNDFNEFDLSDLHLSFPSVRKIFDSVGIEKTRQPLLNSFFESLKSINLLFSHNNNSDSQKLKLEDGPSKVAGSSIMAAIICQEIIKSFSKKDAPLFNVMILDPSNLKNLVSKVGC